MIPEPSDELLNALIDGELGPDEAGPLLARLQVDAALRERVAQLTLHQDLVRHAYAHLMPDPPASLYTRDVRPATRQRARHVATWALTLAGGAMIGWLAHGLGPMRDGHLTLPASPSARAPLAGAEHIVLHLSASSQQAGAAALDRAEGLLGAARAAARPLRVEIVANSDGLSLLRLDQSPHAQRIASLQRAYPDLALVACGQTAQRLREAGIDVRLLPGVNEATSALDQIVQRMRQGWDYMKI